MKLAVVMAAFRESDAGRLDLASTTRVHNRFESVVGGRYAIAEADDSDPAVWRRVGEPVALRWLAYRSIVRSSNLATNLLLEAVGFEAATAVLRDLGCDRSVIARGIEDYAARDAGLHNIVTAADLATQLQSLAIGTLLTSASNQEILDVLAAQQIDNALPAGLPPETRVAHKSGWVPGVEHDAGIVYPPVADPYIVSVCTTTALPSPDAVAVIAAVSAAAYADITR